MEIFDVHRRDVYNFDDYMDLKKPGFGGPSSGKLLKDKKGKEVNKDRKLTEFQNTVVRHEQFKNQVYDPTYKAMGGDLVHKQDQGKNPNDYPDPYENMGIPVVQRGELKDSKPKYSVEHTNEGKCHVSFDSFLAESAINYEDKDWLVVDKKEKGKDGDCNCSEDCDCDECSSKT